MRYEFGSNSMLLRLLLTGLLALACTVGQASPIASRDSSAPEAGHALTGPALVAALRQGGYVIFFRHTATDFSRNDAASRSHDDCANQRLLSAEGRAQAQRIGQQVRRLQLPVTEVLASPMCRTMDTAQRMLQRATPRVEMREREGDDYPGLKALLAAPVAPGGNRWLVGHGTPFRAIAGAPHLAEGEAAVIQPGGTRWTVVARVAPDGWAALR